MKKLPISLVVVTFNEEKNIERCLRAADFCEELLVIDSGSTDKTIEIAKSLGARVMHRDWTGYGDQKNFGTNAASQDWVLCIDADEVVTSELRDSILQAFIQSPNEDAFEINRHGIYAGHLINHSGWYPEWRIFLYKKGKAEWTGLEPHTTVKFNGERIRKLNGDLLHYTYADIREHLKKNIASAYASAVAMKQAGRRARMTDFLRAPFACFRRYFMQLGFLDGFYGFVIAVLSGVYTFLKYAFLRELYAAEKTKPRKAACIMKPVENQGTICALLFRRVGDSLLATPAIRAIKKSFPDRKLLVFAEPQVHRVFESNPWIDMTIDTGKSPSPFHLARLMRRYGQPEVSVDFLSDPRSALACFLSRSMLRIGFAQPLRSLLYHKRVALQDSLFPIYSAAHKLNLAHSLGADSDSLVTEFYLKQTDLDFAQEWRKRVEVSESRRIVAIFPYSRREYKRWPSHQYVELCSRLNASSNVFPVLISGPGEADYCQTIATAAGLDSTHSIVFSDLGEMAALLSISNVYVGNDGGPKHLAVAVKTPTVTIFGNDPPEYWTPPNSVHIALSSDSASASGTLSVDTVLDAVRSVMESK